jgi:RND family efflux transporter MFP subunit
MTNTNRRISMIDINTLHRASVVLAVGAVLAGCGGDEPAFQPPEVTVATPVRRSVQTYAEFTGTTRAIEYAEIRARVPGVLEQMRFDPGSIVEGNEILFVIERDQYRAAYEEAIGNLRAAQAESARAESDLRRVEQAIQTDAVSQSDLDRAVANRDQANAAVISARGRRDNARLNLDYTLVRSPIRGQVGRNQVDIGNLVGSTEPTVLTTVNKIDSIYVYFDAPEALVLALAAARREATEEIRGEIGRTAISLANETGFPHEGVVDFIDNTVDPATGTIEVRAVFANADTVLFPGLFVRARVYGRVDPDALVVDERAVGTDLAGKYVLVLEEDNVVEQRFVTLGPLQDDGTVVVEEGLDGSESYIVNGLLRARPGFPVTPQQADSAVVAPVERN